MSNDRTNPNLRVLIKSEKSHSGIAWNPVVLLVIKYGFAKIANDVFDLESRSAAILFEWAWIHRER